MRREMIKATKFNKKIEINNFKDKITKISKKIIKKRSIKIRVLL